MSWFEKIVPSRIKTERRLRSVPEGLWIKCPGCAHQWVWTSCPQCHEWSLHDDWYAEEL